MALNFPSTPNDNDTYTSGTTTWVYNSTKTAWIASTEVTYSSNSSGLYPLSNTSASALGSTTQRWVITANTITTSGAATINDTLAAGNTTITGFVYTSDTVNAISFTVGTDTIANSTGVYTGVVNGSSLTVGTSTIANSTGVYTGVVNGSSVTVGSSIIANTTRLVIGTGVGLQTNASIGSAGQILTSNGSTPYWNNQLSAGTDYVAPGAVTTSGLTQATARLLGRTTASTGAVEEISVGAGLTLSAGSLTAAGGGATTTSAGADVTLTAASDRVQSVGMTAAGLAVYLPDATTVSEGGPLFVIRNTGEHSFDVLANGGAAVRCDLASGDVVVVFAADITTARGRWATLMANDTPFVYAGSASVFESANTDEISVAMLSSTKAIVCYRDAGNSNYGTSCILDVSGSTITPGTPAVYDTSSSYTSVAALSATQAIVCYRDDTNSDYGTSCILDVSGSTITPGTPTVFESAGTVFISVAMLSSTKAIVCYRDAGNSNYGTSCILDVSGSTITPGTPTVFESAIIIYTSVAALSATKAIVCYADFGNSSYGTSCILDVSGSTITPGTPAVYESAESSYISVAMLSSTKAIVCYTDVGNSNYGTSCILDVSGSTITPGTPAVFSSVNSSLYVAVAALTSAQAIVCYRDGVSVAGAASVLSVEGSAISASLSKEFETDSVDDVSVTMLTATKAIVVYGDQGNSTYGTAVVLRVSAA